MYFWAPDENESRRARAPKILNPNLRHIRTAGQFEDHAERVQREREGKRPGDDRPKGPAFPMGITRKRGRY